MPHTFQSWELKHPMSVEPTPQAAPLSAKHRRLIAIWLTISLAACIAALTLMPLSTPQAMPGTDKIHHIIAFMTLTLPCAVFYPRALFQMVVAATTYGALIEIIQPYIGRSGDFADFVADLAGVGLGVSLGLLLNMTLIRSPLL
jgi:VanZ family protein